MCHFVVVGGKYAGSLDTILETTKTVSKYFGGRPLAVFMMKPRLEDMVKLTERLHENAIPLVIISVATIIRIIRILRGPVQAS